MIGHLGSRVSALLDDQLSPVDEERAWNHVHSCHECRDAVEREGWVKTRLASVQFATASAPSHLKGSLLVRGIVDWPDLAGHPAFDGGGRRRHLGLGGIGGGAVGAAVMGVLALGASPAHAPGAVVSPGTDPFGATLTHAVTTVLERGQSGSDDRGSGRDTPPATHSARRRLTP